MHYVELLQLLSVCGFAWFRGDKPERAGALAIVVTWLVSDLMRFWVPYLSPHDVARLRVTLSLGGDFVVALAFLAIAVHYSSLWLGAVLLVQGAQLTLHSVFLSDEPSSLFFYIVLSNALSGLVLLMIFAGTCASWRARIRARRRAQGSADDFAQRRAAFARLERGFSLSPAM